MHKGDCFLVPGPVRMSDACLQAMATPVMTARGPEFRQVMAELNSGLRYAFNLSPSAPEMKTQSWTGEDGYKVVVVSGSGTAAMEMVIANRFRNNDLVLVPTNGKFGERVADICRQFCNVNTSVRMGPSFDCTNWSNNSNGLLRSPARSATTKSSGITQDAEAIAEMCERHGVSSFSTASLRWAACPSILHGRRSRRDGSPEMHSGPSGIAAIA